MNIYNLINKSENQLSFDEVLRIKNHKENLSQILKNKNETEAQNKNITNINFAKKTVLEQRNFTNSLNSTLLINKQNNKHLEFNIFPLEVKSNANVLNNSYNRYFHSMNNFTNNKNISKNNDKLISSNLEEVLNDKISKQKAEKMNLNKEKKESSSNEYLNNKFEIYENDNNEAYLDKYKATKHNNSSNSVQNKKLRKTEKIVLNDLNYVDLLERDKQNFAKYDKMVTICISLAIMGFLMVLFLGGILFMYINTNTNRISKSTN